MIRGGSEDFSSTLLVQVVVLGVCLAMNCFFYLYSKLNICYSLTALGSSGAGFCEFMEDPHGLLSDWKRIFYHL